LAELLHIEGSIVEQIGWPAPELQKFGLKVETMIDLETYRSRIGTHYQRKSNHENNKTNRQRQHTSQYSDDTNYSTYITLLAVLICITYMLLILSSHLAHTCLTKNLIKPKHKTNMKYPSWVFLNSEIKYQCNSLVIAIQLLCVSFSSRPNRKSNNMLSSLIFLASCALLLIVIANPSINNPGPNQNKRTIENKLKIVYCNVQGLLHMNTMTSTTPSFQANKISDLRAYLYTHSPDLVILNETWLTKYISDNEVVSDQFYTIYRKDRTEGDKQLFNKKGGGGVMILCKNNTGVKFSQYKEATGDLPILSIIIRASNGYKLCISTYYRYDYSNATQADEIEKYYLELIKRHKNLAIIGDLNLSSVKNWETPVSTNSSHTKYLDIFDNLSLSCLINSPTHQSGNILDLILTNQPELFLCTSINPDLLTTSDHFTINTELTLSKRNKPPMKIRKFCFKKADWKSINEDLNKINWKSIFRNLDIKKKLDLFKSKLDIVLRKHIPMVLVKAGEHPPWYDSELKNLKRRVDRARKSSNSKSDNKLKEDFMELETSYRELVKSKRANYFVDGGSGNTVSKKLYKHISSLSHSTRIPDVIHNDHSTSSKTLDKCNMFNSFFSKQFSGQSNYNTQIDFDRNHPSDCNELWFEERDVFLILKNLDPSKAAGPDNIEGTVLKNCRFSISKPLSLMFNSCFQEGNIPAEWKDANVVPIHKKNSKNDVKNYRPISLTCLVMKVFEKLVRDRIYFHCKDKITVHQHGFLPQKSCNTQLIEFTSHLTYSLNNHLQTDIVYFDFSKAFDSVSHDLILEKLKTQFNINGKLLNFVKIYLQNRRQRVVLDNNFSDWAPVSSGVPQGSILGPLLFVLFINDIVDSIGEGTHIKLYADDLKIWREIRCKNDSLQAEISNLEIWSDMNKIKFHPSKCKVMRSTYKRTVIDFRYYLGGVELETVTSETDLGVIITSKLSYTEHIDNIVSRSSQKLGLIKRHCNMISDKHAKRTIYLSLVRSLFEHCSQIWRPSNSYGLEKFEKVQKRAVKWILNETENSYSTTEYSKKLEELKLLPICLKFLHADLTLLQKIIYSHIPISFPSYLHMYNRDADFTRPTRFQCERDNLQIVCTERARIDPFSQSFFYRTHTAWNELPLSLREISDQCEFSVKLKSHLLESAVT
jgi:hypothetical protein